MRAARLDKRITIQSRTEAQDSTTGETTYTWADVDTVWAEVQELRGREYFAARQVQSDIGVKFTIRYRSDVTVLNRISYGSRTYNIRHIATLGRKYGLEIFADAQVT